MIDTGSLNALLHGTTEAPPAMPVLRAGPVTVLLDGVDLRYMRIGRTELVRRVYAAVRDRNWNTVPGTVSGLDVDARDDSFDVRFRVRHTSHDVDFSWDGAVSGDSSGRVTYSFDGHAERDLQYNRIGRCAPHPWREPAGRPYRVRPPEGELRGEFPALIGPQRVVDGVYHALFPAYDRLEVELEDGGSLLFEFEGGLWEPADHGPATRRPRGGHARRADPPLGRRAHRHDGAGHRPRSRQRRPRSDRPRGGAAGGARTCAPSRRGTPRPGGLG